MLLSNVSLFRNPAFELCFVLRVDMKTTENQFNRSPGVQNCEIFTVLVLCIICTSVLSGVG